MPTVRFVCIGFLSCFAALLGQSKAPVDVTVQGHIYKLPEIKPTGELVAQLKLPPGFHIEKWAENLKNPRIIAVAEDGAVYVSRRDLGDVVLLRDTDRDGRAEPPQIVAQKKQLHGLAIHANQMFLATVKEIFVADRKPDGLLGPLREIVKDLPDGRSASQPDSRLRSRRNVVCFGGQHMQFL